MAGGRCEACEGAGQKRIEMHFLPDVWVTCDACGGTRYTPETLAVKFHGKTIADVLDMSVDAALELFGNVPKIRQILQTLARRRPGLHPARPGGTDALRRRGPAREARRRARPARHRQDALHPRRADHRAALRRHPQAAGRDPPPGRPGQHGGRHRAQPRGHQDGRLGHRPRPRGGPGRRRARRRGDARGDRQEPPQPHREVPQGPARRRPARRAARGSIPRPPPAKALEAAKAKAQAEAATSTAAGAAKKGPKGKAEAAAPRCPGPLGDRRPATGIPRTASPATAARPAGTAGSSSSIVDASRPRAAAASLRPTGPSAGWCGSWASTTGREVGFPFFHATTSGEWVVTLRFFVPRNTFQEPTLARQLRLVPFHESPTPVLSDAPRLRVTDVGPTQEITITGHSAADFETDGFDAFLSKAVAAFLRRGRPGS